MKKISFFIMIFLVISFLVTSSFVVAEITFNYGDFYPVNETFTNNPTPMFSYNISSDLDETLTCHLMINGQLYGENESDNMTVTNIAPNETLTDGIYIWSILCNEDAQEPVQSDEYKITVDTTPPLLVGLPVVQDLDNFLPINSLLNVSVNVADALSDIKNVSFDLSSVCNGLVTNVTSKETDDLWWSNCTVNVNEFMPKNITFTACDATGNCGPIGFYTVVIYNFTLPEDVDEENYYLGFDATITTNLSMETNLADVNYVLGIILNGSQLPGQPFSGKRLVAVFDFESINFTNPSTYMNLANLANAIEITIKDAKGGEYGGSRIFIDTGVFAAFDTETEIKLYRLPFSFVDTNDIFPDEDEDDVSSVVFLSNGDGTGNLTFTVSGFSGYNITDDDVPVIAIKATISEPSTTFYMNVTLNGTGTEIDTRKINLTLYSDTVKYNYTYENITCDVLDNNQTLYCNTTLVHDLEISSYRLIVADYGGTSGNSASAQECFSDWSDYSSCSGNTKTRTRYCYGSLVNESASCGTSSGGGGSRGSGNSGGTIVGPSESDNPKATQMWLLMNPAKPSVMKLTNPELGLTEITISVKNPANNVQIKIEKLAGKPAEVTHEITGKVYKFIKIEKVNLDDNKLEKAKLKFKVEKKWMNENKIKEENVVLMRYTNKWQELETKKSSSDNNYVEYEAESPGFSYFAIAVKEEQKLPEQQINPNEEKKEIEPEKQEKPVEERKQEEKETEYKPESKNKGALIAIILFLLLGAGFLGYFYYTRYNNEDKIEEKDLQESHHEHKQKK